MRKYLLIFILIGFLPLLGCTPKNQSIDLNTELPVDLTTPTTDMDNNQNSAATSSEPNADTASQTAYATLPGQLDLAKTYQSAIINTNYGAITVKFYRQESPKTVNNFMNLAQKGFYNNTKFHRVIKDFMIQGGDPNTKTKDTATYGMGGPEYKFADEFNNHKLVRGSLAMANSGPDTNGSQFFIVTAESTPWLDGHHTNFGQVTSGMAVVDKIEALPGNANNLPNSEVIIKSIQLIK